jgi:hypothetical protein
MNENERDKKLDKLTDEHKAKIKAFWNKIVTETKAPPALKELVHHVFPGVDSRTKTGRLIRSFLVEQKLRVIPTGNQGTPVDAVGGRRLDLTKEQLEYIKNNMNVMKPMEMAKLLFKKEGYLHNRSEKYQLVDQACKRFEEEGATAAELAGALGKYIPPGNFSKTLEKIYNCVENHGFKAKNELSALQKKQAQTLQEYLSSFIFQVTINSLATKTDRQLFETTFIRYVYDKADLQKEDLDLFIALSRDVVDSHNTYMRLETLRALLRTAAEEEEEGNKRQITMNLNEAIDKTQSEFNNSQKRIQALYKDLTKTRSTRLKEKIESNQSLLTLIQAFQDYEKREKIVKYAKKKKEENKKEIQRLQNIDDLKFELYGVDPTELLEASI